jgi:hypothetical protein
LLGCIGGGHQNDQPTPQATVVQIQSPPIQQQQTPVWCWAASIQNVLASYNVSVTQDAIVEATYGNVANLPLFVPQQAVLNLLNENYLVAPQNMVIHPFFVAGAPTPSVLIREIGREHSPILTMYTNGPNSGHVVVCYGAKYTGTADNPTVIEVWVKDPWDAQNKIWSGAQLASVWQSSIFLRVAPRPPSTFLYNGVPYSISSTFDCLNQYTGLIDGRVWFFNEDHRWHAINNFGADLGPIP